MRLMEGTKIEFQREICNICQISFSSDSMPFPRDFCYLKKSITDRRMDQRTDGRMDGKTLLYTHLKTIQPCIKKKTIFEENDKTIRPGELELDTLTKLQ